MRRLTPEQLSKDWTTVPKFRHNLWTTYEDTPDTTYVVVSHAKFEVPRDEADTFLKMRGYCTGHHTIPEIAKKSELPEEKVQSIVSSLMEAGVGRPPYRPIAGMTEEEIRQVFFDACRIWGEQLAETYISAEIQAGKVSRPVVLGWLLESYHYIRCFPEALAVAAKSATGELAEALTEYANQERGHEVYVLRSLERLGFKKEEVEQSLPLVSTKTIDLLMKELYSDCPCAALLVAAVVEAGDMTEEEAQQYASAMTKHYDIPADALQPFQEHVQVDARLGHGHLHEKYAHLIKFRDETQIHNVVNRMHDLKHAYDLQSLEISHYYSRQGNYVPRQFVDFFGV